MAFVTRTIYHHQIYHILQFMIFGLFFSVLFFVFFQIHFFYLFLTVYCTKYKKNYLFYQERTLFVVMQFIQYFLKPMNSSPKKVQTLNPPLAAIKWLLRQLTSRWRTFETNQGQQISIKLQFLNLLKHLSQKKDCLCQHNLRSYVFKKYAEHCGFGQFRNLVNTVEWENNKYYLKQNKVDLLPELIEKIVDEEPLFLEVPLITPKKNYQPLEPKIIFNYELLYSDEVGRLLCALANTACGGQLILGKSIISNKIVKGFQQFSQIQVQNFQKKLQTGKKLLRCKYKGRDLQIQNSIKIKVQQIPIFESLQNYMTNRFDEFVIKVKVMLNPYFYQSRNFIRPLFYLQHKLAKNIPAICQMWGIQGQEHGWELHKICEKQVYGSFLEMSKINRKSHIANYLKENDFMNKSIEFNIKTHHHKQKVLYQLSINQNQRLASMLKCLIQDNLQKQFPLIGSSQHVLQLRMPELQASNIEKVIKQLSNNKIAHKIITPLAALQKQVLQHEHKHYSLCSCSYSYSGSYSGSGYSYCPCSRSLASSFMISYLIYNKQQNSKIIKDIVNCYIDECEITSTSQIIYGSSVSKLEQMLMCDFLYQKFCCVPRCKRQGLEIQNCGKLENFMIQFADFDKNAELFTHLMMILAKKSPRFCFSKNKKSPESGENIDINIQKLSL